MEQEEVQYLTAKEIAKDVASLPVDISEVKFVLACEFETLQMEHIDVINDALKKLEAKDNEISRLRFELSKLRAEIHG